MSFYILSPAYPGKAIGSFSSEKDAAAFIEVQNLPMARIRSAKYVAMSSYLSVINLTDSFDYKNAPIKIYPSQAIEVEKNYVSQNLSIEKKIEVVKIIKNDAIVNDEITEIASTEVSNEISENEIVNNSDSDDSDTELSTVDCEENVEKTLKFKKIVAGYYQAEEVVNGFELLFTVERLDEGDFKGMWMFSTNVCRDEYSDPMSTKRDCLVYANNYWANLTF